MTPSDVAEWLRVDPQTVRKMVSRGDLPTIRIGDEFRFAQDDLVRWTGGKTSDLTEVYTLQELADQLQVSKPLVRREINEGRLHGVKMGNRWRITQEAVDTWIQQLKDS